MTSLLLLLFLRPLSSYLIFKAAYGRTLSPSFFLKSEQRGGGGDMGEWDDWLGAEDADLDPAFWEDEKEKDLMLPSSGLLSAMETVPGAAELAMSKSVVAAAGKNVTSFKDDNGAVSIKKAAAETNTSKAHKKKTQWDRFSNFDGAKASFFEGKMEASDTWGDDDDDGGDDCDGHDDENWSEEAPYFDEADVVDDEGHWGRSLTDTELQPGNAGASSAFVNREGGGLGVYSIWDKSYDVNTGESWSSKYNKEHEEDPDSLQFKASATSTPPFTSGTDMTTLSSPPSPVRGVSTRARAIVEKLLEALEVSTSRLESYSSEEDMKSLVETINDLSSAIRNVCEVGDLL